MATFSKSIKLRQLTCSKENSSFSLAPHFPRPSEMFKGYRLKSEKEFSNSTLFFFWPDWLALDLGQMLPQGQPQKRSAGSDAFTLCSRQLFSENLSKIVHFCPLAISPRTQITGGGKGRTIWQSSWGLKFESNLEIVKE